MRNPAINPRFHRGMKWKHGQRVQMTMHYRPGILPTQLKDRTMEFNNPRIVWHYENSATERFDFLLGYPHRASANDEIKLNLLAINMTVVIHNDGFNAAAIHVSHHLGNANRLRHH